MNVTTILEAVANMRKAFKDETRMTDFTVPGLRIPLCIQPRSVEPTSFAEALDCLTDTLEAHVDTWRNQLQSEYEDWDESDPYECIIDTAYACKILDEAEALRMAIINF